MHIKVNPRRKGLAEGGAAEHPPNDDEASKKIHPARRWIVDRTISWLVKRRSLRTRFSKKAENWLTIDSVSLLPHFAQSGGFRIESYADCLMTVKIGGAIDGDGHIRPPLSLPFPMNDTPAGGLVTMESNTLSEPLI